MARKPQTLTIDPARSGTVVALSGGVGGTKLALGLSRVLPPGLLTIVANTGDDFEHLGFFISPDLDTLTYALAGVDNLQTGWGRRDETWSFMTALGEIGGETWFKLGDRDLAMHVERTRRLKSGEPLSAITADIARRLGIEVTLLPMTDNPVRTKVATPDGVLDFQDYFVRRQSIPAVTGFAFDGAAAAVPVPGFLAALKNPQLRAVVICPSNPFISIDPILAVPGVRAALTAVDVPVVAVSPIIAGRAVKGPTAKMMRELGLAVSAPAVAEYYRDIITGFMVHEEDADATAAFCVPVQATNILMRSLEDRERLARAVLEFADCLTVKPRRINVGGSVQ